MGGVVFTSKPVRRNVLPKQSPLTVQPSLKPLSRESDPLVLVLLACGVVILIQLVGIMLVLALLTIQPGIMEKQASSPQKLMLESILICFAMCLIGLIISYYGDTNTSSAIVGVAISTYLTKTLLELAKNRLITKY